VTAVAVLFALPMGADDEFARLAQSIASALRDIDGH